MRFEELTDLIEFRGRTQDLLADEARHNLIRGVLNNLILDSDSYDSHQMMLAAHGDETFAAALMTQPYNLIVADAWSDRALRTLVTGVAAMNHTIPGVIGNKPTVDRFVDLWLEVTGEEAVLGMAQGVFALDSVIAARPTRGTARIAGIDDLDLVVGWFNSFVAEAIPDEPQNDERLQANMRRRLRGESAYGVWLWDVEGTAVALTAHGGPTGSGIRIGPVYTPPEHRGNGYASSLVAAQSQWLLDNGYEFCFLFTDLSNPISNRIYENIGYRRVADSASYRFVSSNPEI